MREYVRKQLGFTLVEVVIALIVGSILGTIIFQFMNTSLAHVADPVNTIQETCSLDKYVELMTADYGKLIETDSDPLGTLRTRIQANTYGQYTQTTEYIIFSGGSEAGDTSGENLTLKVNLSEAGQSVTLLFTKVSP